MNGGGKLFKKFELYFRIDIFNSKETSRRGNLGSSVANVLKWIDWIKTTNFILLFSAVVYGEYETENRVEWGYEDQSC